VSNKEFKKINESWDKFLNEEIKELSEQEQLDEALITAGAVAKVIFWLSQKDNLAKGLEAILSRDDVPDPVRNLLERVQFAVHAVDEELPAAVRAAVELRGKAPDSWMGNILTSIFASQIRQQPQISMDEPEEEEDLSGPLNLADPLGDLDRRIGKAQARSGKESEK